MKKYFKFSSRDKEMYEEEIRTMIDQILPYIVKFYKQYEAQVVGVSYDSTIDFHQKTKVKFEISAPGYYPSFDFEVSRLGSAFRTPKERQFDGVFHMQGLEAEYRNQLYTEHGISSLIMVKSDNGDPISKIRHIFSQAEAKLAEWKNYGLAHDVFIF